MFCCLGENINHGWKLKILRFWWNRPTKNRNDDKDHNSGIHQHSFFFIYSQSSFTKIQIELMIWYILQLCDGTFVYSTYAYLIFITNNIHQYSHFRWPRLAAWRRRILSTRRNWRSSSHQRIFDILLKSVRTKKAK